MLYSIESMLFSFRIKKTILPLFSAVAVFCIVFAGCARRRGEAEADVSAQTESTDSEALKKALADRVVPIRSGFVAGEGALPYAYFFYNSAAIDTKQFSFDQEVFASFEDLLTSLLKNQIQAAVLEIHDAAKIWSLRHDSVVMAGVLKWGDWVVISGGFKASSFSELSGKNLYISSKSSLPDMLFCAEAKDSNLEPLESLSAMEDLPDSGYVLIDYRNPAARIVSVLSGFQQDLDTAGDLSGGDVCAVLGEPYSSIALLNNSSLDGSFSLCDEYAVKHGGKRFPQLCVLVNRSFAENNGTAVIALQEKLSSALAWLGSNPRVAAKTAVKYRLMVSENSAFSLARDGRYLWANAQDSRDEIEEAFDTLSLDKPGDSFYFSFAR